MLALFRRNRGGSDPRERRPSNRTPRRLTLESLEGRALLSVGPTTLFDINVSVPSANGGAGEYIHITGDLHDLLGLVDRAVDRLLDEGLEYLNSLGNLSVSVTIGQDGYHFFGPVGTS